MPTKPLHLTKEEQAIVSSSMDSIRAVLKRRNIHIKNIIGLVTKSEKERTARQVEIRFAEKTVVNVQMNMIAFD